MTIAGQRLTVKSDAAASYVRSLADLVDQKVRTVSDGSKVPTFGAAVLAALSIADDLFRERAEWASVERKIRERSERVLRILDSARPEEDG